MKQFFGEKDLLTDADIAEGVLIEAGTLAMKINSLLAKENVNISVAVVAGAALAIPRTMRCMM